MRTLKPINQRKQPVPTPGWTTEAKVVGVHDGDTLTVEITRQIRVRLLDCWAPELATRDKAEKVRGVEAAQYLQSLLPIGYVVTLQVPVHGQDVSDWMTLGRVLGRVWCEQTDVAAEMVRAGHATPRKP